MATNETKTKWTPGPWDAHIHSWADRMFPIIPASDSRAVAMVGATGLPNDANARLIAAAPDLYEALASVMALYRGDQHGASCAPGLCCCIYGAARAALAKAEGR
jgi:hypothetical protein